MAVLMSNASITHTIGNVLCVATEQIKSYFGEDYFETVHIGTKLAYRQLDAYRVSNSNLWKLKNPILILRPRLELNDTSNFMYGTAKTTRLMNVKTPMEYSSIETLLHDDKDKVRIGFLWNRLKVYFDIVVIHDTYNEHINISNHLKNTIAPGIPYFVHTNLESYIPKNIVYPIADFMEIDRDKTAQILQYLNTYSYIPFTYKFKNGSGNEEYFALYDTNIEIIPSEFDLDNGTERGLVTQNYMISFTLSMEFNIMGCYYLMINDGHDTFSICRPDKDLDKFKENVVGKDGKSRVVTKVIPLLTIPLFDLDLEPGWRIATAPILHVVNPDIDETDLSQIINDYISIIIQHCNHCHIPYETFFHILIFDNRTLLSPDSGCYKINITSPTEASLYLYHANPEHTYRLVIVINNELVQSVITEATEFYKEK